VYVVQEGDVVELRPVKVGTVEGERALFESGLDEGDRVVVQGLDRLQPGTKVDAKSPAKEVKSAEGGGRREKVGSGKGRGGTSKKIPPGGAVPTESKP
jgi:hypothetical protein